MRGAGARLHLWRRQAGAALRACRCRVAERVGVVDREISARRARAVRGGARGAGPGRAPAARRPPSADPDRGRAAGARSGIVSAVLDRGPDPGRKSGRVPADPPAHHDADRGRRGVQFDLGLQDADRAAADRLRSGDDRPCRRDHAPAPRRRARRSVSGPHRLSWRDRSVAGDDGGGAALRAVDPELRGAGAYAAHRRDRCGVPACVPVRAGHDASGRCAGAGGRHR